MNSNEGKATAYATGTDPPKSTCKQKSVRVNLPDELPALTPEVSRILLHILMELKEKVDQQNRTDSDEHTKKID
ncbi:hypothetical protein GCM10011609_71200 [Lentzea pudingi]|uniref:Uncharacterized protein n=1 Tax=Lentzea pudingi TaxID=1789439 RepID=A0ABQ2IQY4_9PSEU|nr:hypothetical protein GCM10011609_71200 [Lentzea pudingi]